MKFRLEKKCGRFSDSVSHEIDITAYSLHRDQPTARELKILFFRLFTFKDINLHG